MPRLDLCVGEVLSSCVSGLMVPASESGLTGYFWASGPCVSICLQGTDWCSVIKRRFSFSPTDYAQQPQLKFNRWFSITCIGLPGGISDKESACQCRRRRRCGFSPWVEKILWRRKWQPTSLFLPGKSHGQRRLVGYSPWGLERVRQLSN